MEVEAGINMENMIIVLRAYWKMFTYFWPIVVCAIAVVAISEWQLKDVTKNDSF